MAGKIGTIDTETDALHRDIATNIQIATAEERLTSRAIQRPAGQEIWPQSTDHDHGVADCDRCHLRVGRIRWHLRDFSAGYMLGIVSRVVGIDYDRLRNMRSGQARAIRCAEACRLSRYLYRELVTYSPDQFEALGWPSLAAWLATEHTRPCLIPPPPAWVRDGLPRAVACAVTGARPRQLRATGWRPGRSAAGSRVWYPPRLIPSLGL